MSEQVVTRKIENLDVSLPTKRDSFYQEQVIRSKEGKSPETAVDVVSVLLFNEHGEVFVQKRAKAKFHNPSLIDKSMGGHIQYGDSPEYTVMVETVQELQVPSITVYDPNEFEKALNTLRNYISTVAVVKPIDKKVYVFNRIIDGEVVKVANYMHLYFGLYSGRIKTVDREAAGILQYSVEDLKAELSSSPKTFTHDLHVLLKDYEKQIIDFVAETKLFS